MAEQSDQRHSNLLDQLGRARTGRFLVSQGARLAGGATSSLLGGFGIPLLTAIILILIFTFMIVGVAGGPGGLGGPGGPTPTEPPPSNYTIPIRDISVIPNTSEEIKRKVEGLCSGQQFGKPHLELWDRLIQTSIANGWNPSFVSALWIEETGAQCPANYDDAIGCGEDPNLFGTDAENRLFNYAMPCLNSFINRWFGTSYDNSQFTKFMCYYADGPGGYPACNSEKYIGFSSRIYIWYTRLAGTPLPLVQCTGTMANFNARIELLPLPQDKDMCRKTATESCGRPGECMVPHKVVLHTTAGSADAEGTYQYFANGSGNRGVASHFIVGKDGEVLQLVNLYSSSAEKAWAVANYGDHISIEMVDNGVYNSKNEVPPAQYQATLNLVKQLLQQYNIPAGNVRYNWKASSNSFTDQAVPGVYGHYQLNPETRIDPGIGFERDLLDDLNK